MMKKLLMAAVAVSALASTPAFAAANDFVVTGSVTEACSAVTGAPIAFGAIATDSATGFVNDGRTLSSTASNVWCNGANSTISYTKTDMTGGTATSDPAFTTTIGFTPSASIGGTTFASGAKIGIRAGGLVVSAGSLTSNSKIPTAGSYSGTVSVTLTPVL